MDIIHTEQVPPHTGPVPPAVTAGGATLADVVRVDQFGEHRPARSVIQSAEFGRKGENARYMLEVTAYRG